MLPFTFPQILLVWTLRFGKDERQQVVLGLWEFDMSDWLAAALAVWLPVPSHTHCRRVNIVCLCLHACAAGTHVIHAIWHACMAWLALRTGQEDWDGTGGGGDMFSSVSQAFSSSFLPPLSPLSTKHLLLLFSGALPRRQGTEHGEEGTPPTFPTSLRHFQPSCLVYVAFAFATCHL